MLPVNLKGPKNTGEEPRDGLWEEITSHDLKNNKDEVEKTTFICRNLPTITIKLQKDLFKKTIAEMTDTSFNCTTS